MPNQQKPAPGIIPPDAKTSLRLRENRGKIPGYKDDDGTWVGRGKPLKGTEADTLAAEIESWGRDGAGVGMMTRNHPVFDNDSSDPRIAAGLSEIVYRVVGTGPVRGRPNSPRITHMCKFRGPEFGKKRLEYWLKGTPKPKKSPALEFLGNGQYTNVDGPHPSGVRYEWKNGHPCDDGVELPEVDEEIAAQVLAEAKAFLEAKGFETEKTHGGSSGNSKHEPIGYKPFLAPSDDALREALKQFPNTLSYDDFIKFTAAIKAACGGSEDFYPYFEEWALEYPDNEPDWVREKWESIREAAIGWRWLLYKTGYVTNPEYATSGFEPIKTDESRNPFKKSADTAEAERILKRADGSLGEAPADDPASPENPSALTLTLAEWRARDLPEPDFLMGRWLTTTSRVILNAATGLGKTNIVIAKGMAVAAGLDFLHWVGVRPAIVLYIDGEMSRRLLKQRLADAEDRLGAQPKGFHALSHEDIENFAPLNTKAGQVAIERIIKKIGTVDLIIFDNIMSLIAGDMKDEESWSQTMPWIRSLTARGIGQIWVHHTGHDKSRGYGSSTREWQMDTVIHLAEIERPDTDVSFKLSFPKARERTPAPRRDFADVKVALLNDKWTWKSSEGKVLGKISPQAIKFIDALRNATKNNPDGESHPFPIVSLEAWREECFRWGLIDRDKDDSARSLFSKNKRELIAANHIACTETTVQLLV